MHICITLSVKETEGTLGRTFRVRHFLLRPNSIERSVLALIIDNLSAHPHLIRFGQIAER
jgi:hypothetical protein